MYDINNTVLCATRSAEDEVLAQLDDPRPSAALASAWHALTARLDQAIAVRHWMYLALSAVHNLPSEACADLLHRWVTAPRARATDLRLVDDVVPPGLTSAQARAAWHGRTISAVALRQAAARTTRRLHTTEPLALAPAQ